MNTASTPGLPPPRPLLPPPPPPPPPSSPSSSASWVSAAVTQAQKHIQPSSAAAGNNYPANYYGGQYGAYSQYQYAQAGYGQYPQYYGSSWPGYGTAATSATGGGGATTTATTTGAPPPPPPPPPPPSSTTTTTATQPTSYAAALTGTNGQQQQQQQQQAAAYQNYYGAAYGYPYYNYGAQQQQQQQYYQYAQQQAASYAQAAKGQQQQQQQQQQAAQRTRPNRFAAAKSAATTTKPQEQTGSPPELNKWVERCFLSVKHSTTAQQRMEKVLMEFVREMAEKGLMWKTDWDNKPLLVVSSSPSPSPTRSSPSRDSSSYHGRQRNGRGGGRKRSRWESSSESEDSEEEGELVEGRWGRSKQKKGPSSHLRPQPGSGDVSGKNGKKGKQQQGRAGKRGKKNGGGANGEWMDEDDEARQRRLARFHDGSWKPRRVGKAMRFEVGEDGDFDFRAAKAIVGTCQELEKEYFRLNEVPHPSAVRPAPILRRALALLQEKFDKTAAEDRENYYKEYLWTQLKAIRQDLLVQNIRDEFAVQVYETHARIALQCADLNEYNQCQTQLMEHYRDGLQGSCNEFRAYRLLYYVYLQSNPKFQDGDKGLIRILSDLKSEVSKPSCSDRNEGGEEDG